MTRPRADVLRAKALIDDGWPVLRVARELDIPRSTIRTWARQGFAQTLAGPGNRPSTSPCDARVRAEKDPSAYAYLFGQYLGDGTIDACPRGVFKIRVFCCSDYPGIIGRTIATGRAILPGRVTGDKSKKAKLVVITSYWKHMPCLFPQHGPGRKHERVIMLDDWQSEIVVGHPERFLRGLIESDGCRVINRVNGGEYPRYMFSNRSPDIRALFVRTVEQLGLHWTTANQWGLAVSRRPDVEYLDRFIGPKG
jgi:hypothetical protein